MNLSELRTASSILKKSVVPARIVTSQEDATRLTERDPAGIEWFIGDKYYVFEYWRKEDGDTGE